MQIVLGPFVRTLFNGDPGLKVNQGFFFSILLNKTFTATKCYFQVAV